MKQKLLIGICVLGMYVGIERSWLPATTSAMQSKATAVLLSKQKPPPPKTFTYDGCTLVPEHTIEWLLDVDLSTACLNHDIAYWLGGTDDERSAADTALRTEISAQGTLIMPFLGVVMGTVVHYFGDGIIARAVGRQWGHGYD
jgi:hypothetical protein